MKKILVVLLAALLLLAACGKKAVEEEPVKADAVAGGWTASESFEITEEIKALLEKGLEGMTGAVYVPVAYLGSQVVAGRNHCVLCQVTPVVPDAKPHYALVYLYAALDGQVKLLNVADLNIVPNEDGTLSPLEGELAGGWAYAEDFAVTEEIQGRLNKATEGMVGAAYVPVANLGTQVVAGLNRCLLCQVTPVVPEARPHYALVYVYEALDGGGSLLNVIDLDVGALCDYGAGK